MVPKSRGSHPYLEAAFEMQVFAGKPNTTDDVYTFTAPAAAQVSLSATQEDMEKIMIERSVEKNKGNLSKVAGELGITRATLYRKMEKFDI